jgi:hypothetical protein
MTRLLHQTLDVLEGMPADWSAGRRLEEILRWSLQHRMRGGVPHLPSTRGALQRTLLMNLDYLSIAMKVNKRFYSLVAEAKEAGDIHRDVPDDVIVFTLYSRSCDPTVEFLLQAGKLSKDEIVEAMVSATFRGLEAHFATVTSSA